MEEASYRSRCVERNLRIRDPMISQFLTYTQGRFYVILDLPNFHKKEWGK